MVSNGRRTSEEQDPGRGIRRWLRDRGRPLPDELWVSYRLRDTGEVVTTEARRSPSNDTVWLRTYIVDVPEATWARFPPAEATIPILPGRSRILFVPINDSRVGSEDAEI